MGFADGHRHHQAQERDRPVSPHPEASPPCGRCARAGAARLAAWSWSTCGAPLHGARWEGGRGGDVVPSARSRRPSCAVRRFRTPGPLTRRVAVGAWPTCWGPVHPVHVLIPRCERASAGLGGPVALTLCHHNGPPPGCGSMTPSPFFAQNPPSHDEGAGFSARCLRRENSPDGGSPRLITALGSRRGASRRPPARAVDPGQALDPGRRSR